MLPGPTVAQISAFVACRFVYPPPLTAIRASTYFLSSSESHFAADGLIDASELDDKGREWLDCVAALYRDAG